MCVFFFSWMTEQCTYIQDDESDYFFCGPCILVLQIIFCVTLYFLLLSLFYVLFFLDVYTWHKITSRKVSLTGRLSKSRFCLCINPFFFVHGSLFCYNSLQLFFDNHQIIPFKVILHCCKASISTKINVLEVIPIKLFMAVNLFRLNSGGFNL